MNLFLILDHFLLIMSAAKRSSKIVSYSEQDDDDDDFIPIVDNAKKNQTNKSKESSMAMKKRDKKPEPEEHRPPPEPVLIEIVDNQSSSSQSTASNDDEPLSPKHKRLKHDEDENEAESIPEIQPDVPTISLTRLSDHPKPNSSIPLGFPTSKINIPSPHVSRVGLSRKSLPVKPLHPNLTSRVAHE